MKKGILHQWNPEKHERVLQNLYSNKLENLEEMNKFLDEFELQNWAKRI
jgi:hypothetical protein